MKSVKEIFESLKDVSKRSMLKYEINNIINKIPHKSLTYEKIKEYDINGIEAIITLNYEKSNITNFFKYEFKEKISLKIEKKGAEKEKPKVYNLQDLLRLEFTENNEKILKEILPNLLTEMKDYLIENIEKQELKRLINNIRDIIKYNLEKLKTQKEISNIYEKIEYVKTGDPRMWDTEEGNKQITEIVEYKGKDISQITSLEELKNIMNEIEEIKKQEITKEKKLKSQDVFTPQSNI